MLQARRAERDEREDEKSEFIGQFTGGESSPIRLRCLSIDSMECEEPHSLKGTDSGMFPLRSSLFKLNMSPCSKKNISITACYTVYI